MNTRKHQLRNAFHIAQSAAAPGVRAAVRFPLQLSVVLDMDGETVQATTENVSASGISLLAEASLKLGRRVNFELRMPGDVLGTLQDVRVTCKGRVVRCQLAESGYRIAATIDEYSFLE
jgi:hypothetical protein